MVLALNNPRVVLAVAVVLGLATRLAALNFLPDQQFPDAGAYVTAGRDLFETGIIRVHRYMPLYPAWTYITGGGWLLKAGDIVLSLATIVVLFRLSLELFADLRAAALAALAAAVYPHFVFYSVSGLTETAFLLLISVAFLMLYRERYLAGFAAIVLSILVRPAIDLLAPILVAVFVVSVHKRGWRAAALRLGQYALIYVVLMSPWWAHQYVKYDRFVRLNLGDGIVWLAGNHPGNRSGGGVGRDEAAGESLEKPSDLGAADVAPFVAITDEYEQNEAMRRAAFGYIRDDPARFAEMAAIKFVRFWRLWPYAPEYERPAVIAASLLSYGVMLMMTLWFLAAYARPYIRPLIPVFLFAAFLTAVHMATIASIRYRFPLEGFLVILGSYALARIAACWSGTWRRRARVPS